MEFMDQNFDFIEQSNVDSWISKVLLQYCLVVVKKSNDVINNFFQKDNEKIW